MQREHLLVTTRIEVPACREVLNGVNNLIKISVVIAVARMLAFDFRLEKGRSSSSCGVCPHDCRFSR
jgi:hypothetical protein